MNGKKLLSVAIVFTLSIFFNLSAQAEKKSEMPAEMQAMMAKTKKLTTPGAEHAVLKNFVGNWKTTNRAWMKPGDKAQESSGSSSIHWVLNGRFIQQNYKGDWAGQPFEGVGYTGYDKVRKEYVSTWMDNMSTGIFQATGQYDRSSRTLRDNGTVSCPMTGEKDKWFRSTWKSVSYDKSIFTMYTKDENGKEYKSMEMVYRRVK